jgi:hypothetical protein
MTIAVARSPSRQALTNVVAASCGELAGKSRIVVVVGAVVVVVVVVVGPLERSTIGDESVPHPMNATAHTTTPARRITEST